MLDNLDAATLEFRLGMEGAASAKLTQLIDALGIELNHRPELASNPRLLDTLREVLDAQGRADYLRIADLLEFELRQQLVRLLESERG